MHKIGIYLFIKVNKFFIDSLLHESFQNQNIIYKQYSLIDFTTTKIKCLWDPEKN